MNTKIYSMQSSIDERKVEEIANLLKDGETVAFPTETVYGLGADATNERAIANIFTAKGRPSDNPLIVHVATKEQLYELVEEVPPYVELLIDHFSPGPITYVLRHANHTAPTVTAGLSTVGVRIPDHPVALAILEATDRPIAAPSANRSGRPSPTEASHVKEDLSGRIAAIVDGGSTDVGIESTVVDCTKEVPLILRPGTITQAQIADVAGACDLYEADVTKQPKSPGMKYVHYAPAVPLILVGRQHMKRMVKQYEEAGKRIALLYASEEFASLVVTQKQRVHTDDPTIAQGLYRLLRSFQKEDVDIILWEYPTEATEQAVLDRLTRAATDIIL